MAGVHGAIRAEDIAAVLQFRENDKDPALCPQQAIVALLMQHVRIVVNDARYDLRRGSIIHADLQNAALWLAELTDHTPETAYERLVEIATSNTRLSRHRLSDAPPRPA